MQRFWFRIFGIFEYVWAVELVGLQEHLLQAARLPTSFATHFWSCSAWPRSPWEGSETASESPAPGSGLRVSGLRALPGKPVAQNCGLLGLGLELFRGEVACCSLDA